MATVELVNLCKRYGDVVAVDHVSLTIHEGEFVSLLGPSGCGKTTTLRMIAGFTPPTSGEIRIGGRLVNNVPPHRRDTGMVFQNYALFPHMTVEENVAFGLRMRKVPPAEIRRRVAEALELVKLSGLEKRMPRELSGGQQQRVALARALAIRPQVLLLDEPLSNLDAKLRIETRSELRRIQKEIGITTILVTHDQEEALAVSDKIAIMNMGRLEQVGTPDQIYEAPATRFVAGFIGRTNFLHGHIQDGRFVTRSGLEIPLPHLSPMSGPAILSIRPERITIANEGNAGTLQGQLQQVAYMGDRVELIVRLEEDQVSVILPNSRKLPSQIAPGRQITLLIRPEDCHVFSEEDG